MHAADLERQPHVDGNGYGGGGPEGRRAASNGGRPMDTVLLGAAGVALAAAVALAYRRGQDGHASPDEFAGPRA